MRNFQVVCPISDIQKLKANQVHQYFEIFDKKRIRSKLTFAYVTLELKAPSADLQLPTENQTTWGTVIAKTSHYFSKNQGKSCQWKECHCCFVLMARRAYMKRPSPQSVAMRNKRGDSFGSPSVRKSWLAVLPTVKRAASSSRTGTPKAIGSCSNLPSYNHAAHDLFEGENLPHSPLISTKLNNICHN